MNVAKNTEKKDSSVHAKTQACYSNTKKLITNVNDSIDHFFLYNRRKTLKKNKIFLKCKNTQVDLRSSFEQITHTIPLSIYTKQEYTKNKTIHHG